ncbi:MAG: peptidylprolyl isomerase [Planctomycetota bacterium]
MVLPENNSIAGGKVVALTLRMFDAETQELLDECGHDEPLYYLHGSDNIAPGLEQGLAGLAEGSDVEITLAPEEAFGMPDPDAIQVLDRSEFPDDAELEVGLALGAFDDHGNELVIFVTDIDGNSVTVSGNHPLAGLRLRYEVHVLGVRDARPEELEHGHPNEEAGDA